MNKYGLLLTRMILNVNFYLMLSFLLYYFKIKKKRFLFLKLILDFKLQIKVIYVHQIYERHTNNGHLKSFYLLKKVFFIYFLIYSNYL